MIRISYLWLALFIISCDIQPSKIEYDYDHCHACKMTISDKRFAAQVVTQKGKPYKFDAIECMIPEIITTGADQFKFILVTDYNSPGKMIDAKIALYLISEDRPSPMGSFLSAYSEAYNFEQEKAFRNVRLLNFESLVNEYSAQY